MNRIPRSTFLVLAVTALAAFAEAPGDPVSSPITRDVRHASTASTSDGWNIADVDAALGVGMWS